MSYSLEHHAASSDIKLLIPHSRPYKLVKKECKRAQRVSAKQEIELNSPQNKV